ncbi:MAG TPA: M56 family metallopeptidase [Mucilaginibacter sp.]
MPALFVFLLKVNVALLLFCAGYYLVLRHLTFYTLNRIYLVAAILFASVYPKINLDNFAQRHQQLARPAQIIVLNLQTPAAAFVKPLTKPNYWYWAGVIFWTGALLLALRLLMQLYSLYKMYRNSIPATIDEHNVRLINDNAGPFSFWQSIYVNPKNHKKDDLKAILLHEQIHINEWHTLDVLLAELSTIFYWFNPGVWLMKKAIRENIEFITDRKILRNGIDTKQYQYSLVNVSFAASPQNIVNHFNLSTIKKRIIMMNAKRSSNVTLTRYAFLVPIVLVCLLSFSISKAELIKKSKIAYKAITKSVAHINIIKTVDRSASKMSASIINFIQPKDTANKTKLVAYILTDTIKKHRDTIRIYNAPINYSFSTDSNPKMVIHKLSATNQPVLVIDGKVVNRNELNFINPNNIDRIDVDKTQPKDNTVLYLTTKSSDGKQTTRIKVNGHDLNTTNTTTINNGQKVVLDTIKIGKNPKMVNGHMIVDTFYVNRPDVVRAIAGSRTLATVTGDNSIAVSGFSLAPAPTFSKDLSSSFPGNTSISQFSNKMVIIDGKISTEADMKKLSAFDIDRIVVKTDEETKSLYGDKAKNGILFIVTKKKSNK